MNLRCYMKKQKRLSNPVSIKPMSVNEFFLRGKKIAHVIDKGGKPAKSVFVSFEDPSDMLKFVTTTKLKLLNTIRKKPVSVTELANTLKRERSAVARDIKQLEGYGLVHTKTESNPGHGIHKIVYPMSDQPVIIQSEI